MSGIVQARRWLMTAAIVGLSWIVVLAVFRTTTISMVSTWQSAAYSHGLLILPIFVYLVWTCRRRILHLVPAPERWGLAVLLVLGLLWFAGHVMGVVLIEELALVSMLQALVWTLAGAEPARALIFPLAFLFFAVPMGEGLIAPLQDFTAYFAVKALQLSAVPVLREGRMITTGSGLWQVAEACSGISFVISSAVIGSLYSYKNFVSRRRRFGFFAAALSAPVIANGLRVYTVILLAHVADSSPLLRGFSDATVQGWGHRLHGWAFFVVTSMALFWVASRWHETLEPDTAPAYPPTDPGFRPHTVALTAAMSVVLLVPVYLTADAVSMRQEAEPSTTLATAPVKAPWTLEIPDDVRWMPHFAGASSESLNTYAAGENVVELFVAYYARQTQGAELVNDENAIADTSEWTLESEQDRSVVIDGKRVSVRESAMRSPAGNHRLIWQWYWIDGQFTSNPYRVKFLQAKTKLLGGPLAAAAMTVSTVSKRAGSDAAAMMQDFLNHAVVTPRL